MCFKIRTTIFLVFLVTLCAFAFAFSGGDGSLENPYQITMIEDLNNVRNYLDANFILMNDLNLYDATRVGGDFWNDENGWESIGTYDTPFNANFDGNGFKISGVYLYRENALNVGLFGYSNGDITNLILEDINYGSYTNTNSTGGIVGRNHGNINNSSVISGTITGYSDTGGLVGENFGIISNSSTSIEIYGQSSSTGGLIGYNEGTILDSSSSANVQGYDNVGGLIGNMYDGTITDSNATGNVTGDSYVGGLVGYKSNGDINYSFATGIVEGTTRIGGLIGYQGSGNVLFSYATGNVTGSGYYLGGLIAYNYGNMINSYSEGNCVGAYYVGGLVGENGGKIIASSSSGDVNGTNEAIGGLVGYNGGHINNAFVTGNVYAENAISVGGIVGQNGYNISNVYFLGTIEGSENVGGLVGRNNYGTIQDSFSASTSIISSGSYQNALIGLYEYSGENISNLSWLVNENVPSNCHSDGNDNCTAIENIDYFYDITNEPLASWNFISTWDDSNNQIGFPDFIEDVSFTNGNGTVEDPYQIFTLEDLQKMANINYLDKHFILMNDINAYPTIEWMSGKGFDIIGSDLIYFTGSLTTFEDNNYTISGLNINRPNIDYVGLFGVISDNVELSNLTLADVNIIGNNYVGALTGWLGGTITNVHSSGNVEGEDYIGGLVGAHGSIEGIGSSSPLVHTWNGNEYEYVADVGRSLPRNMDGIDYAQINKNALAPLGEIYSIKVSQEYDEIVYFDELELMTFDHASGYEVVPSAERSKAGQFFTISNTPSNPVISCTDMFGNDCTADVNEVDDKWTYRDSSNVNSWELNFGDLSNAERIILVTKGARDYSLNSDEDIRLIQVKNAAGQWVDVFRRSEFSAPGGSPRTAVFDLTEKFLTNDYRVKVGFVEAKMNYFAIDTSEQQEFTINTYHPTKAELGFRGYTSINKENFWDHNYYNVNITPPELFSKPSGNFTKYGDVSELFLETDNQYVVMHHGDNIDVEFDYVPVPEGMERSFILYNYAQYKHSSTGEIGATVNPLPFIGMSEYPYTDENYPYTEENLAYLNEWNTRKIIGIPYAQSHTIISSSSSANVNGEDYVGGLVGNNIDKDIQDSFATGSVYADEYVGGLVGYNEEGTINNSFATGSVYADDSYAGGFIGENNDGTINNSYASGNVTGAYDEDGRIGGFVGTNPGYGVIEDCNAYGNVTGPFAIGGFSGGNGEDSTIRNSIATGDVNGFDSVGGFSGRNGGTIEDSYSTGEVKGIYDEDEYYDTTKIGGFVGRSTGDISRSYSTGNVSAIIDSDKVGGFIGENPGDIEESFSTGDVNAYEQVGGFSGVNGGENTNVYSTGNVYGCYEVGGFSGRLGGLIINGYATGNVTSNCEDSDPSDFAGFVGYLGGNNYYEIYSSYSTGQVIFENDYSGTVGGLIGSNNGYIYNSGWLIQYGLNAIGSDHANVDYEEENESAFFSAIHEVYTEGDYTWDFENVWLEQENDYPILRNVFYLSDTDGDGVTDDSDPLLFTETQVIKNGLTNDLNILVGGQDTNQLFSGEKEIVFYDGINPIMDFNFNFDTNELDLSKVEITVTTNGIVVDLNGQLQYDKNKTLYLTNNDFISLCVKNAPITSISEISSNCDGLNEYNFTQCLTNGTYSNAGISCTLTSGVLKVNNLRYSGILGTITSNPPTSSSGSCTQLWSCSPWTICVDGNQTRTCTKTNNCNSAFGKPIESQACTSEGPIVDPCTNMNCNDNDSCTTDSCNNGICDNRVLSDCGATNKPIDQNKKIDANIPTQDNENNITTLTNDYTLIIGGVILLLLILVIIFFVIKNKNK
jgi:hypothetical protein